MAESTNKTITVQGETFEVSQPYGAGHTCTEAEAKALNQVRAENIANNMRAKVKASLEGAEGAMSMDEVRAEFAKYDADYVFTLASVGGGRKAVDPVEREALKLAREVLKGKLADQGHKITELEKDPAQKDQIAAKIAEFAQNEQIVALAKKKVKEQDKVKSQLADINFDAPAAA